MTEDEAISDFGIPSSPDHRRAIIEAIETEMIREAQEEGDQSLLKCLCIQLFSIGTVEDSLLIWRVKSHCFDLMCGVDVQLLCGGGLEATRSFLTASDHSTASDALRYLDECVQSGDFQDWTPAKTVAAYRGYYQLTS
jgi:hypothetical protein